NESQSDQADYARIDPLVIQQQRHGGQHHDLQRRDLQRDQVGLQRSVTLNFVQVSQGYGRTGLADDQEEEQTERAIGDVAPAEHLQLEKRQRVKPLIGQQQWDSQRAHQ